MALATRIESSPKAVDLVLDVFRVCDQLLWIATELVSLFLRIFFVLPEVVRDLHKPDTSSHEDIQMFHVRLHLGHCLNRGCAGANHGDAVVRPLFLLIVLWPDSSVYLTTFELLYALDLRPLEVVEDASRV